MRSKVNQLKRQDDIRSRAVSELAVSLDIEYKEAEKIISAMVKEVSYGHN